MDLNFENLNINDFLDNNVFNANFLRIAFGNSMDLDFISNVSFTETNVNQWVWAYHSHNATISSTVYNHINSSCADTDNWKGWDLIWKLSVVPRIKTFIWKLAHDKLTTGVYLYNLNIGPYVSYPFCELYDDSASHLIWLCSKVQHCWTPILIRMNKDPLDLNFLCSGRWLEYYDRNRKDCDQVKALIATMAWIIWKERYNHIFQNANLNLVSIPVRAINHCNNFFRDNNIREFSGPSLSPKSIFIYADASWTSASKCAGLGFIIVANPGLVLLAGASGTSHSTPLDAEIDAICLALQHCKDFNWQPTIICCDCPRVEQLSRNFHPCISWRASNLLNKLKQLMKDFPDISISTIPREKNSIADELAAFGLLNPSLSLFFRGLDRHYWLDELCASHNLFF
ncbi:uncharacterized protein LOC120256866 [Dioscorea cayenensis subsp. rotundata]|uniref:Uncharacterized protein LOC120256866 n=1 Tax=Dioscorea cayennensis subsp. rotundata TaxID=55577 RepID=A0AB40B0H7_DIOCR|nr:uncharacterized protein LOC120256866 [Dioscorea cayenensis subsp. rotundata]